MQRHWSQTCIQHRVLGPFCREKSLSKITRIHPAKKAKDEKNLCAEGTVAAVSIYETRNCISKRIQEFSPLRKLLTRIHNKPPSIYMPLNWGPCSRLYCTLQGSALPRRAHISDLAIPEVWISSPALWPITPLLSVSHPFFPSSVHIPLFVFSILPLTLSPSSSSAIILLLIFQTFSPSTHKSV